MNAHLWLLVWTLYDFFVCDWNVPLPCFIFRGLNTAAVETLQETVWRRLWLLWMEQSIVSNTTTADDHITAAGIFHRDRVYADRARPLCSLTSQGFFCQFVLFLCRPCSRLGAGSHSDHHSHAEGGWRNRLHGWRVRRWDGLLWPARLCRKTWCNLYKMAVVLKEEAHCDYFDFSLRKAQIATSNALPLKLAWRCLLLTSQNQRSWSLLWTPTLK